MYQESQWYAFQDILINHQNHYNTMIRLNYYFGEMQKIEYEYAEGLSDLEAYLSQVQEIGTLGKAIDQIKHCLANKIKKHFNFADLLSLSFFASGNLQNFLSQHRALTANFNNEESTFNHLTLQVEKAKDKYHEVLGKLEKSIAQNANENKSGAFDAAKLSYKNKTLIKNEESERINYCKTINFANEQREAYVERINEMLTGCERIDNEFIGMIQNKISNYATHEMNLYTNLKENMKEMLREIDVVDPAKDIQIFCNSTHRHGQPPNKFDFVVYRYENLYKAITKDIKSAGSNYKMEIKQYFRKNFKYFPPEGIKNNDIVLKYNKIEQYAMKLWQGNEEFNDDAITETKQLLLNRELRLYFLKCANYYRLELYPLKEDQFSNILNLITFILKESTKKDSNPDYEVIKFVIILSQTFYRVSNDPNEPQYLLQNDIMNDEIWKSRSLWEGLIEFTIDSDMSNSVKKMKQKEEKEERIIREKTTVQISLVTFKFIMKCFKCSLRDIEEIIKSFCGKYDITDEIGVFSEDEVQEIKKEIFEEENRSKVGIGESDQLVNQINEDKKGDFGASHITNKKSSYNKIEDINN